MTLPILNDVLTANAELLESLKSRGPVSNERIGAVIRFVIENSLSIRIYQDGDVFVEQSGSVYEFSDMDEAVRALEILEASGQ